MQSDSIRIMSASQQPNVLRNPVIICSCELSLSVLNCRIDNKICLGVGVQNCDKLLNTDAGITVSMDNKNLKKDGTQMDITVRHRWWDSACKAMLGFIWGQYYGACTCVSTILVRSCQASRHGSFTYIIRLSVCHCNCLSLPCSFK